MILLILRKHFLTLRFMGSWKQIFNCMKAKILTNYGQQLGLKPTAIPISAICMQIHMLIFIQSTKAAIVF